MQHRIVRWLPTWQPRDRRAAALLCFPFAGGGLATFAGLRRTLTDVDVLPVVLPGRGHRLDEAPLTSMRSLVEAFVEDTRGAFDRPYGIYGHSMGGIVAFEVTKALVDADVLPPLCLLPGAAPASHQPALSPLHQLDDADLLRHLAGLSGRPEMPPELAALLLPSLRADLQLCETHRSLPEPIATDIVAFAGADDPRVSEQRVAAWRELTTGAFAQHTLPGGHFFLDSGLTRLTEIIRDQTLGRIKTSAVG